MIRHGPNAVDFNSGNLDLVSLIVDLDARAEQSPLLPRHAKGQRLLRAGNDVSVFAVGVAISRLATSNI